MKNLKKHIREIYVKFKDIIYPPKYPCSECHLVISGVECKELCDKVEMNDNKLRAHMMDHNTCADCGVAKWYMGPCGGASQNIKCAGCGHKFNHALPMLFERISLT